MLIHWRLNQLTEETANYISDIQTESYLLFEKKRERETSEPENQRKQKTAGQRDGDVQQLLQNE